MYFKQFYLGCLSHASYLIGADGQAAVVDPQRDVDQYIAEAEARGLRITYVVETHMHADFVSGHTELARRTGATIVASVHAHAAYEHLAVKDGDVLELGPVRLAVLETPGHTPDSISLLVTDTTAPEGTPQRVLTGDALFYGDVGRPDLVGSRGRTATQMAEMLYDSLRDKLMTLPHDTLIYPAHGAGSLCGKRIEAKEFSTIGIELSTNYALQPMSKEAFVEAVTQNQPEIPQYFPRAVATNIAGAASLDEIAPPAALDPAAFAEAIQTDQALVLDLRENKVFGAGHVKDSLSIPLAGTFAQWAGFFIGPDTRVYLVGDADEQIAEAVMRLARVGLHNATGYLDGGIAAWQTAGRPVAMYAQLAVDEVCGALGDSPRIVDVRRPGEFSDGHADGAINLPLDQLEDRWQELVGGDDRPTLVMCRSGVRSSIAGSILTRHGIKRLHNLLGGYDAWHAAFTSTSSTAI